MRESESPRRTPRGVGRQPGWQAMSARRFRRSRHGLRPARGPRHPQIDATVSSTGPLVLRRAASSRSRSLAGAGSASRSTFPFGVSGSASSTMKADGIIGSGSEFRREIGEPGSPVQAGRRRSSDRRPSDGHRGRPRVLTTAARARRVPRQCRLDLAELDPKAANLDLAIHPAEAIEVAVGPPAGQVACAVEPAARLVPNGSGTNARPSSPACLR